jgi:type I restriction enzyme S subunit
LSFTAYPKYKDSGVEWLGELPEHWNTQPLWTCFKRDKRIGHESEELLSVYRDYGVIPKSNRSDNFNKPSDDLGGYQLVNEGDLVINKMKAWQGSVAISDYKGIVSPAYFVYISLHNQNSRYLHYLMRSSSYIDGYLMISKGIRVNQWDLQPEYHSRMSVVIPTLPEQTAIAEFLDRETAKIDELVEEQRRLIELLKEKRQAVISHAVTKGLDPDVLMKDSGIEWLGEVPEHWTVLTVRRLISRIEQGWSPPCYSRPAAADEWGVVKSGCVNRGVYSDDKNKALPEDLEPKPEYEISVGDLLMSRASGSPELVGSIAFIIATRPRLLLSDKIFRIHTDAKMLKEYFSLMFNSTSMRSQIENAISGAQGLANNLPQAALRSFYTVAPPPKEQFNIIHEIMNICDKLDELIQEACLAIALLQERRTALISAAVTGKIDVRNYSPVAEGVPA